MIQITALLAENGIIFCYITSGEAIIASRFVNVLVEEINFMKENAIPRKQTKTPQSSDCHFFKGKMLTIHHQSAIRMLLLSLYDRCGKKV